MTKKLASSVQDTPVSVSRDGDVAIITMTRPPVNAMDQSLRAGLFEAFSEVACDGAIKAIVLTGTGRTFMAGAEIREFDTGIDPPTYHDLFDLIENSNHFVVAALHGTVLGAGLELSLACHYRVAVRDAALGLPELSLGIIPGAGGTQRLPRLVGVEPALEMILSGKPIDAHKAFELGLVDEVVADSATRAAIEFSRRLIESSQKPRRTAEQPVRIKTQDVFAQTRAELHNNRKAGKASFAAVDAVEAAVTLPFKEGLAAEGRISANLITSVEARALRHLFFAEREARRVPGLSSSIKPLDIQSVAVVGAGTMGRGIAMSLADAGVPTTLMDVSPQALESSLAAIRRSYQSSVERKRLTQGQYEARMSVIRSTLTYADIAGADLVIEAAVENMEIKRTIFSELDRTCKPQTVLATNTSTLDVDAIAASTSRPQSVIGLHFFSPANVMRLLEIVRGKRTSFEVLATGLELAKRLRKVAVVSQVAYGFIGNRMMDPYAREAERMLLEGATPQQVDAALESYGMAMGIHAVFDMAGIDVGVKARSEAPSQPDAPSYYRASAVLVEHGRLGQKTGRGFYRYDAATRQRIADEEAIHLIWQAGSKLGIERREISEAEILDRCLCALINEGAALLSEGVALRASDIDVVYSTGYGFPSTRGGPMFYADTVGLATILAKLEALRDRHGSATWRISPLLRDLAMKGQTFADYDRANKPTESD